MDTRGRRLKSTPDDVYTTTLSISNERLCSCVSCQRFLRTSASRRRQQFERLNRLLEILTGEEAGGKEENVVFAQYLSKLSSQMQLHPRAPFRISHRLYAFFSAISKFSSACWRETTTFVSVHVHTQNLRCHWESWLVRMLHRLIRRAENGPPLAAA